MIGWFSWIFGRRARRNLVAVNVSLARQRDSLHNLFVNFQTLLQILTEKKIIDGKKYDEKFKNNWEQFQKDLKASGNGQK